MISAKISKGRSRTSNIGDSFDDDGADIVYLVPELCHFIGPSEQILLRKACQKEIRRIVRVEAPIMI